MQIFPVSVGQLYSAVVSVVKIKFTVCFSTTNSKCFGPKFKRLAVSKFSFLKYTCFSFSLNDFFVFGFGETATFDSNIKRA